MAGSSILTRVHLEQALTPDQLRITAIIRIALMLGVTIFLLMIFFMYSIRTPDSPSNPDPDFMDTLSIVHAAIAVASVSMAFFLSRLTLRKERLTAQAAAQTSEQLASQAINLYRVSSLLLIAPIEGAAFFGSTICLLGVMKGTMILYPIYWLNAVTTGILLLIGLTTFPTRERVLATLETAFVQQ